MILSFDLDDTLYSEITFVKSGYKTVSNYLNVKFSIPKDESYSFMTKKLQVDRKGIFDELLSKYDLYTKTNIRKCLSVYRNHKPQIKLFFEADQCLKRFSSLPIYIVTDGNKIVQKNKIKALGLNKRLDFYYITSNYGLKYSKPSAYCFYKICKREKANPAEVVYIADDPYKDFVGLKPLGFKTIRVMTGRYKNTIVNKKYDADYKINSLKELTNNFMEKVFA